jgi:phosphoserine phosphatase RsbU/P
MAKPADPRLSRLLTTLSHVAMAVELEPTLQVLIDSLAELVPFDAGGIFARDADSHMTRAQAVRGFPPDLRRPESEGIVGLVMQTGTPRLVRDVAREPAYVPVRPSTVAQLTVPLSSPRGVLGAMSLEADRAGAFSEDDLALTVLFAQQGAILVERALLHEQLIHQSRIDRELEIAREILHGLTPSQLPPIAGLQLSGRSITAGIVGGDAYDFIPYPDAQIGLSISDAKGKGLPAALLAMAHRSMLRALVTAELRLRAMFTRINHVLAASVPPGDFVTNFYGIIDVSERRMVYVNAGHPPPFVVRADGHIDPLTTTAPVLGFTEIGGVREAYVMFGPGDTLVLFTDGVTDVGPSPEEFFDVAGVQEVASATRHSDARWICERILEEVVRRAGGALPDDATVVVAKIE